MPLYSSMYMISSDEYRSLSQTKCEHDKLVDSIRGDVNGGQVNHIEIGEGGKVVIKPTDMGIVASAPSSNKLKVQEKRKNNGENANGDKDLRIEDVLYIPPKEKQFSSVSSQTDSPKMSTTSTQSTNPLTVDQALQTSPSSTHRSMQTVAATNTNSSTQSSFPSRGESVSVASQTVPLEKSAVNVQTPPLSISTSTETPSSLSRSTSTSDLRPNFVSKSIQAGPSTVNENILAQKRLSTHSGDLFDGSVKRTREAPPAVEDVVNERLNEINEGNASFLGDPNEIQLESDESDMEQPTSSNTKPPKDIEMKNKRVRKSVTRVVKPTRKSTRVIVPPTKYSPPQIKQKKTVKKSQKGKTSNKKKVEKKKPNMTQLIRNRLDILNGTSSSKNPDIRKRKHEVIESEDEEEEVVPKKQRAIVYT